MGLDALTASAQDYLKIVWGLQEWSDAPTTPSAIAKRANVGMSTVSEAVRKLAAKGLVEHSSYGAVSLTPAGRRVALHMVRRHRLIETFLHETLGYSWDEVHIEADALEHAVSDLFIDRIDALLGSPQRDPHGDPIPDTAGQLPKLDAVLLGEVSVGSQVRIERISDQDPAILRECAAKGVTIGAVFTVTVSGHGAQRVELSTSDTDVIPLSTSIVAAIYVAVLGPR